MATKEHEHAEKEREEHTDAILNSKSEKIVVVAGPGTGKTFLFNKILERHPGGNTLTLSFINALVDDLSLGLCGMSDIKTLHGFSLQTMNGISEKNFDIFPKLSKVIKKDAEILLKKDINFEEIFQNDVDDQEAVNFYKERKNIYGDFYGFTDIVYATVKYLQSNPRKIPSFEKIVVDEFQDFNKIEVELIKILATKSPIVIAGDDDQSLYTNLKNADPKFIRKLHGKDEPNYESFNLPYCSRSTKVIVEAVNDIVSSANAKGLLQDRIDKPYLYFTCEKKDKESSENSKIIFTNQQERAIPEYIRNQVCNIAKEEKEKVSILVIVPPQIRKHVVPLFTEKLREKGFKKIRSADSFSKELTLFDGLKLILLDQSSNLGWRIVAETTLDPSEFESLLKESLGKEIRFIDLLPQEIKNEVKGCLTSLRAIRDNRECSEESLNKLFSTLQIEPLSLASQSVKNELSQSLGLAQSREIKDMDITVTTIPSSKGLAADYVFVTHFNQMYFSQDGNPTDEDVYNFLVALTRAKKRAYLISTGDSPSEMLNWIDESRRK